MTAADGEDRPVCKAANDGNAYEGEFALKVSGKSLGGDSSYARFKIFDTRIPVLKLTTINYRIKALDSLGMNVKIDLLFTNGERLLNIACVAGEKHSLNYKPTVIGEWQEISIPIDWCLEGWMVKSVLVSFDGSRTSGNFNAYIDNLSIKPQGELPQSWDTVNVKKAQPEGEVFYQDSTFIIQGGGSGFFFNTDQFFYVYQKFDKDFQIKAKLESWMITETTSFVGITIRDSISDNSKLYLTGISGATGLRTMKRLTTQGMMQFKDYSGLPVNKPVWIKLVRQGNVYSTFISYDGISWGTKLDSAIIEMDSLVTVGLALTSGNGKQSAMAQFSNVSVSHDLETAIDRNDKIDIPEKYVLYQNYPNPFNPTTTIKYDIAQLSNLQIDIFNILGVKVRSFSKKSISPGRYSYFWDGKNNSGTRIPSGVYIIRMKAMSLQDKGERYTKSIKMTLLK